MEGALELYERCEAEAAVPLPAYNLAYAADACYLMGDTGGGRRLGELGVEATDLAMYTAQWQVTSQGTWYKGQLRAALGSPKLSANPTTSSAAQGQLQASPGSTELSANLAAPQPPIQEMSGS